MPNSQNPLRFDHREIAVIFSLFVFVSLLMFTVGILVGKGLAQAKYETMISAEAERMKLAATAPFAPQNLPLRGTSVSTGHENTTSVESLEHDKAENAEAAGRVEKPDAKLELVPAESGPVGGLKEPAENKEIKQVLANPKLRNIFEAEEKVNRVPASVQQSDAAAHGAFTVQVGSYPGQKDAEERVDHLKKLGFDEAFFSVKEIREKNDTWFRVWLGFFPDKEQARLAGQSLKDKGEVKDYIVRDADIATAKN
ncbi:MAG: SPOR domain-containing protein [Deltaproteobacteria bacterium]|nr:SPOR domain-containing protein [Deltaproteobacteria bacterium]MBI3295234.1 SPOR domain-containing protein [Deltaproteobacteria bacterium]